MEQNLHTTKDQIVEAVFTLSEENLFDRISLSAIAEQVGISKAAIFKHFKNKDCLMAAAQDKLFDDIASLLLENQKLYSDIYISQEGLESAISRIISFFTERKGYLFYVVKKFASSPHFESVIAIELQKRNVKRTLLSYDISDKGELQIIDRRLYVLETYTIASLTFFLLSRTAYEKKGVKLLSVQQFSEKSGNFLLNGLGTKELSLTEERKTELDKFCILTADQFPPENRIFSAFASVLDQEGAAGITVEHIAEKLSMAKSSLYSYFKNKNELVLTLVTKELLNLVDVIEERQKYAMTSYERIYMYLQICLSYFILRPAVIPVGGWLRFRKKTLPPSFVLKGKNIANADYNLLKLLDIGLPVTNAMLLGWFSTLPITMLIQGRAHEFTDLQLREAVKQIYKYIEDGVKGDIV